MKKLFVLFGLLSVATYAHANEQIYVIHTYGDPAIVDIAQDELNRGGGGTARMYQDKLIIKARPEDYARVATLVSQVDTAPVPLTVSLTLNVQTTQSEQSGHLNVGISRRVWVNGQYQNTQSNSNSTQSYTARTLSGSDVGISTSTLVGLANWQSYQRHGRVWANFGTSWVALTDGFRATPTVLPNGQIRLSIRQSARTGTLATQNLSSDIMLVRGQWTKIGDLRTDTTTNSSYGHQSYQQVMPIWVRVD